MAVYTVVYEQLRVEAPFKLCRLTRFEMRQSLNEHGIAYLSGLLDESETPDIIHHLDETTPIKIKTEEAGGERIVFSGVPTQVTLQRDSQFYEIQLVLHSYSIYLDYKRKRRSFQNKDYPYGELLKEVIKDYQGDVLDSATKNQVQNGPLIQYEETDWAFIKRIASHVGAKVYPYVQGEKPQLYVGIHIGTTYKENSYDYNIQKQLKDYLIFQQNEGEAHEIDFVTYQVESLAHYELGDKVVYKQITFAVVNKKSKFKEGQLINHYTFQRAVSVKQKKCYHSKIEGISIEGTVLAVEKDRIKVHLSIDDMQKEEEAYWYSFTTPYTAEGQTGWYVMPEVGSLVQLYMPTQDEAKGYITKVNRLDGDENPKTQDPSTKYFGTIDGKEMKFSTQDITFSAIEGSLFIKLEDTGGIEITSPEDIKLYTEKYIYSESATLEITAQDKIILATNKTSIVIDDLIQMKS